MHRAAASMSTADLSLAQSYWTLPVNPAQVLDSLSSERVLSMEYMTGVGVTDIAALKREGLNPAEVRHCPHLPDPACCLGPGLWCTEKSLPCLLSHWSGATKCRDF